MFSKEITGGMFSELTSKNSFHVFGKVDIVENQKSTAINEK